MTIGILESHAKFQIDFLQEFCTFNSEANHQLKAKKCIFKVRFFHTQWSQESLGGNALKAQAS